jgi:hypothetical protein
MSSSPPLDARRRSSTFPVLLALIALLVMLLSYEVVRANQPHRLTVQLLGVPTTATLLGLALVATGYRQHAKRSSMPVLRYVSRWVSQPERELPMAGDRCWQVRVRNVGTGVAVVNSVSWEIGPARASQPSAETASLAALRDAMSTLDFEDSQHYWIANYTAGMALAPDEERCYFECTEDVVNAVAQLTARLDFSSTFGDCFEKSVSLVPKRDASPTVLDTRGRLSAL